MEVLPKLEEEARKRQAHGKTAPGKPKNAPGNNSVSDAAESRQQAGHLLNVNERYVSDAKRIKEQAPDAVTAKEN